MEKMNETLAQGLPLVGLELDQKVQDTLCEFGKAVVRQNEVMNLTRWLSSTCWTA